MSIHLDTRQSLFRYGSEWNPKAHAQTKGGYIDGSIFIPPNLKIEKFSIETSPVGNVPDLIKNMHPLILHLVKIGKGKREQEKEPVPNSHHWKLEFIIKNGKVYIQNKISGLDVNNDGTSRNVPKEDYITDLDNNEICLGGKRGQLNMVILTPKQDARAKDAHSEDATVGRVLHNRATQKNKSKIAEMCKLFKNPNFMKKVNLKVRFYAKKCEKWVEVCSDESKHSIIDIGSKDIGALEIHDVNPLKSCSRGGRKVMMISEYDLAEGTLPVFQLWDGSRRALELEHLLHQPEQQHPSQPRTMSIRKNTIIFLTPAQPNLFKLNPNIKIKLTLRRSGDGQIANNAFYFTYTEHPGLCLYCDNHLDADDACEVREPAERAKPGSKKKKMKMESEHQIAFKRPRLETITSSPVSSENELIIHDHNDHMLSPKSERASPLNLTMTGPEDLAILTIDDDFANTAHMKLPGFDPVFNLGNKEMVLCGEEFNTKAGRCLQSL